MSRETLLPCCPLCDNPIEVYESATVYVEDGYKALAHEDCVADDGEEEIDEEDLESLSDYDPDEVDDDEFDENY